jgi:hypothetical protein
MLLDDKLEGHVRIWCGLLCLVLATGGCVRSSVEEKNLNPFAGFAGQPASGLVAKLGLPNDERTIPGTEFYVWSTSRLEGSEYEVRVTKGGTGYTNPTLILTPPPSPNQCTIKAAVDDNGMIRTIDWTGNFDSCRGYMDALALER